MNLLIDKTAKQMVEIPDRMTWTASSVKLWKRCKRRFFWKYMCRLTPRAQTIGATTIGGAFHECLADWYKHKRVSMTAITSKYQSRLLDLAQNADLNDQQEIDNLQVSINTFSGMMIGYAETYAQDRSKWKIHRKSIERKFLIDMGDFDYAGKIDLVGEQGPHRFLVEHKTASRIGDSYIERLPLDTQVRGYIYGAQSLGYNVNEVLYDVVRKCKLRRKSNESIDEFSLRVANDYVARPEFYFYREQLRFDKGDLEALRHELNQVHREFMDYVKNWKDARDWTPNDGDCDAYFRTCEFLPLCIKGLDKGTKMFYDRRDVLHSELQDE